MVAGEHHHEHQARTNGRKKSEGETARARCRKWPRQEKKKSQMCRRDLPQERIGGQTALLWRQNGNKAKQEQQRGPVHAFAVTSERRRQQQREHHQSSKYASLTRTVGVTSPPHLSLYQHPLEVPQALLLLPAVAPAQGGTRQEARHATEQAHEVKFE